jgi:alpha-L-fucosidase
MLKPENTPGDTAWFVQDRFGMFIHWGLYTLAARHEWVRHFEEIDNETFLLIVFHTLRLSSNHHF